MLYVNNSFQHLRAFSFYKIRFLAWIFIDAVIALLQSLKNQKSVSFLMHFSELNVHEETGRDVQATPACSLSGSDRTDKVRGEHYFGPYQELQCHISQNSVKWAD
ncbi:hypothetical protein TNCV_1590481 [Trichonephila clavipes]|nr:hypothetical protein TNCV_1590481 [Trichonephila clavipes]